MEISRYKQIQIVSGTHRSPLPLCVSAFEEAVCSLNKYLEFWVRKKKKFILGLAYK